MDSRRERNDSEDYPPYSRLFVVCGKNFDEDNLKEIFGEFGTIEDIRIPRDHNTGNHKGVAYIKFFKTSGAALALEKMHLKVPPGLSRPLKVMVAANRSDIQSEDNDHEKYTRIFISIPKSATESELDDYFSQFGYVDSVIIQKDRNTGESKGYCYIKFRKFSEAALAMEECDKKYRALFAQPKGHRRSETSFESNLNSLATSSVNMKTSIISQMNVRPEGYTRVNLMCSPYLTQYHVQSIFDIIPGMTDCHYTIDLMREFGKGTITYSNPVSAAYAVQKLNNWEYPPGSKIFVKPDFRNFGPKALMITNGIPNAMSNLQNAMQAATNNATPDLAQLANAVAQASKLIKAATSGLTDENIDDGNDLNYCSAKLPPPQPLADIDSPVAKRCFLVCKPQPPPLTVLRDIFCRFGNLINVYTLPNKTVGYARYSSVDSANEAMNVLHGAEVCGVRMKVLEAEEEVKGSKRTRFD